MTKNIRVDWREIRNNGKEENSAGRKQWK